MKSFPPLLRRGGEGRGEQRVTPKMLKDMRQNGSPPPAFQADGDRTFFPVRLVLREQSRSRANHAQPDRRH